MAIQESVRRDGSAPALRTEPAPETIISAGAAKFLAVFRVVLGFAGFILGALLASSFMGADQTLWMIVTWIVGGIVGALIMLVA